MEREKSRKGERERSGPHVGDVQYCSNDAEPTPLATIFSLYLLGIHLVLYSGLLHFIPAAVARCPVSPMATQPFRVGSTGSNREQVAREVYRIGGRVFGVGERLHGWQLNFFLRLFKGSCGNDWEGCRDSRELEAGERRVARGGWDIVLWGSSGMG